MTYVVCQTPKCQQTYPLSKFPKETVNASCEKCGGIVIKDGRANFSQNATVIPVITHDEIEQSRKEELSRKRKDLARLQADIQALEKDEESAVSYTVTYTPDGKVKKELIFRGKVFGYTMIPDENGKTGDNKTFEHQVTTQYPDESEEVIEALSELAYADEDDIERSLSTLVDYE